MLSRAMPVKIRVTSISKNEENEDPSYAANFVILDGPHEGKHAESSVSEPRPTHAVGDEVSGLYDPKSQAILSEYEEPVAKWMPLWAMMIGGSLFLFGAFL